MIYNHKVEFIPKSFDQNQSFFAILISENSKSILSLLDVSKLLLIVLSVLLLGRVKVKVLPSLTLLLTVIVPS